MSGCMYKRAIESEESCIAKKRAVHKKMVEKWDLTEQSRFEHVTVAEV